MKLSIQALVAGFLVCGSGSLGSFAAAEAGKANTDCYVGVSQLELVHGCIYIQGAGPGPCEEWQSHGAMFYSALTRTAINHYQIDNAKLGLRVRVIFNGKSNAQISIQAPGNVDQTRNVGVTYENFDSAQRFPDASLQARFRDVDRQLAFDYDVSCSFGLSDAVNTQESADIAEMNALGPAQEWQDLSAPSLELLPVGTVIELTKDMDVNPGSDKGLTKFVEQNGLMTEVGFGHLKLPYRFAYADFFNANNGYLNPTHYPKGIRLKVTQVVKNSFSTGGHSYDIILKLADLPANSTTGLDPITRITVTGRRSGSGDIKIPQFAALLLPSMSLQLP